ncbi:MAG: tRNA modification GTPase, partial [Limisphaerales bacterium]
QAHQGVLLSDGIRIAICGRPNAGKSSLLNAMVGHAAAIVTDVPGTTRDVLRETITIKGMPVRLMDTAGLRETTETVEKIGTERARQAIADADVVIVVVDDTNFTSEDIAELRSEIPSGVPTVVVHNKVDLTGRATGNQGPSGVIGISALTGAGLDALRATLANRVGYQETEGVFAARRRHLTALDNTSEALADAAALLHDVPDTVLIAEELRIAHDRLGQITGRFTSEDLLGAIFSSFCIGK